MQAGSMQGYGSPEADDYLGAYVRSHALNEHITLIEDVKKHCKIPVIAASTATVTANGQILPA
jgi:dihydroorotate dehydrogenase (fumarate)